MRAYVAFLAGALILIASFAVSAQDSVKVHFFPSYPPPDRSVEFIELNLSRVGAATPGRELNIDRYFADVGKVLAENHVPEQWGSVMVDHSYVQIDIVLGTKHLKFANSYDQAGMRLWIDATEDDKRVASALQKILNLTAEHASERLAAK